MCLPVEEKDVGLIPIHRAKRTLAEKSASREAAPDTTYGLAEGFKAASAKFWRFPSKFMEATIFTTADSR